MVNYTTLQAAIDAGTTNMSAVRNNSGNDDGTDTVATGITWFYFNGVQVTNLYVSGNSWIGFGASSEQLKVNRRDAKVWYEYTETGTIGTNKFMKLRWCGYSTYSQTADAYAQQFDVFLFDNGQIFLNFYDVPTSSFDGTNALVCGSATISYAPTAGTAGEWTFTPTDAAAGTGWSVATGRPNLVVNHNLSGSAVLTSNCVQAITEYASSVIKWTEDVPNGCTVTVEAACKAGTPAEADYSACANGAALGCIADGQDCSGLTLYIRVKLTTTETTLTPTISGIKVTVTDKKYLNFVSEPRNGVFKIYCDISAQTRGVSISHQKNSRLRFWDGTQVPVFSTSMYVAGLVTYIDGGYYYDSADFWAFSGSATENEGVTLADSFSVDAISESCTFAPAILNATVTETPTITLT